MVLPPATPARIIAKAVEDWLAYGTPTAGEATMAKGQTLAAKHIIPHLGGWRLRDLRADEVDRWLHSLCGDLSARSLLEVRSILSRSVRRAMMRGFADRNVFELWVCHGAARAGNPNRCRCSRRGTCSP